MLLLFILNTIFPSFLSLFISFFSFIPFPIFPFFFLFLPYQSLLSRTFWTGKGAGGGGCTSAYYQMRLKLHKVITSLEMASILEVLSTKTGTSLSVSIVCCRVCLFACLI